MTPAVAEFESAVAYAVPDWSITHSGGILHIDDYENFPTETIISLDLETNGKEAEEPDFKIVCVGICGDGINAHVFFDFRPELIDYLRKCLFIAHDGKRAEIPWLNKIFGGFEISQLYFDTKTGYYNYDSARKNYGLKSILESVLGVKYPTYPEIIGDADFIKAACEASPELYLRKEKKPTKKVPNPEPSLKLPKEVRLDKMPKWVTAEYNACDTFWTFKLWVWLRQNYTGSQKKFFKNVEMPETQLIYEMERKGIKIDTDLVRRIHNANSKARRAAKTKFFELAGETINLNSPKQLLPLLQRNGIDVQSTGEEVLAPHVKNDLVGHLLTYRGLQKLCSTYTIPLYFNAIGNKDRRIHARFNQNTITGRLSSSDPINLQNQPQEVRECFIAEDRYGFINADWSNIELRLPAHFSGEPKFITELSKPDGDLHVCTANFIFGGNIKSLTGDEFEKRRSTAKTCNFLLTNSGTAERLAVELKCSVKEAKEIFRRFWEGYPVLANWLAYEKKQARILGGIGTWFGRWVNIPQLRLGCFQPWKCGKTYIDLNGDERTSNCKNCIVRQEAERSAMSIRVQGTAADMCKMATLRLWREYTYVPNLAVHDELNYEQLIANIPEATSRIKYVMENVVQLKVPLVADIGVGFNWKEAKKSCTSLAECTKKKCLRHKVGIE